MGVSSLVLTGLMAVTCSPIKGSGKEGCRAAVESTAIQSGVDSRVKKLEDFVAKDTEDLIRKNLGPTTLEVMSTVALGTRFYLGGEIVYKIGKSPIYIEASRDKLLLGASWNI